MTILAASREIWTNDAIISDTLCCAPDVSFESVSHGWRISRWRQFVGHYDLPSLPQPTYVAHVGGKQQVRMWEGGRWSDESSRPSDATIVPDGLPSRWLVDGELDVVTFSGIGSMGEYGHELTALKFAYADPLGIALMRQVLACLYEQPSAERDSYIEVLMTAFLAHLRRGGRGSEVQIPCTVSSAHRLHRVLAKIRECPEAEFGLEELALEAEMTTSHFCRMFRQATGTTPHQFVVRTKLERAEHMLHHSALPISVIADSLGFKSQGHFARLFRQQMGATPTEFRNRGRKGK